MNILFITIILVTYISYTKSFTFIPTSSLSPRLSPTSSPPTTSSLYSENFRPDFEQETPEKTNERIDGLVKSNSVLLFMKGNKLFPQCGFSNTAVQILTTYGIDFETVDVLADDAVRQGIKDYSQWPTIPQLYVAGEFIGGCDIMIEEVRRGGGIEGMEGWSEAVGSNSTLRLTTLLTTLYSSLRFAPRLTPPPHSTRTGTWRRPSKRPRRI